MEQFRGGGRIGVRSKKDEKAGLPAALAGFGYGLGECMKKQKLDLKNIGLIILAGFAWSKLGLGTAVKEISKNKFTLPTVEETGPLSFDEFLAQVCPACSQLDYEDWLRGQ